MFDTSSRRDVGKRPAGPAAAGFPTVAGQARPRIRRVGMSAPPVEDAPVTPAPLPAYFEIADAAPDAGPPAARVIRGTVVPPPR